MWKKIKPDKLIQKVTNKLNYIKSVKYGLASEQIESKSVNSRKFKEEYNFHRLWKVKLNVERRQRSDIKKDIRFKRTLSELQYISKLVYILIGRLKKRDTPGRFYKSITENTPYVHKDQLFVVRKKVNINKSKYIIILLDIKTK